VQPSPPPLPAANATALERVLWGLGVSPAGTATSAPWSPGGTYGAQEIDYVNSLMDRNQSAPQVRPQRSGSGMGGTTCLPAASSPGASSAPRVPALQAPTVVRADVNLGAYVTGSLLYQVRGG
jgi:hypothetical protein